MSIRIHSDLTLTRSDAMSIANLGQPTCTTRPTHKSAGQSTLARLMDLAIQYQQRRAAKIRRAQTEAIIGELSPQLQDDIGIIRLRHEYNKC
jgi:hypothetical protein